MEKHIRESLNESVLNRASKMYALSIEDLNALNGFENFVYEFKKDNRDYVLRLVHSDHRNYDLVLAEIEFIDHLDKHGAYVSTVYKSINNQIVEKVYINEKDYFSVTAFVKGQGSRITSKHRNEVFWEELGEQIGLFHFLVKEFTPLNKRNHWQEDSLYLNAKRILLDDTTLLSKFNEISNRILSLPKTKDNYGLIHTDIHEGNIVIDNEGKFTIFDFDDSAYKHFISDIAIVIFYQFAFKEMSNKEKSENTVKILKPLLKGYQKNNALPLEEFRNLNLFLHLRQITLYIALKSSGPEITSTDWAKWFFNYYRERIIKDLPFIDLVFVLKQLGLA
jgi:Ser/Thr protein kinase RdoA (MazF antagonist)